MSYQELIKPNTFIYNYINFCVDFNTPKIYDFWCAIFILSMICNRQIKINKPNDPLYPNFFITLVGDDINTQKHLIINRTLNILDNILNYDEDKVNIIDDKISRKNLEGLLTQKALINKDTIIGAINTDILVFYNSIGLLELFSNLYSCPNERKTNGSITNTNIDYHNIFISTLCGDNTEHYVKNFIKNISEYSYIAKSITIFSNKCKKRLAWGNEQTTREELIKQGKTIKENIAKYKGNATLSTEAIRYYNEWYKRRKYLEISNENIKYFYNIESDLILKLALILNINNNFGIITDKISLSDIKTSIKIINLLKDLYRKFIDFNINKESNDKLEKMIQKLINFIHAVGSNGIRHRDLYNKMKYYCTIDEFNYIINTLHELNCIDKFKDFNTSALYYRETDKLLDFDINLLK